MRIDFGTFGAHGSVDVADGIAFGGYNLHGTAEQNLTVYVLELIALLGREMVTYVPHVGGAEQRVADGMYQHVCVTVAKQSLAMVNLYSPKPQVTSFHQLMDIIAHAYPQLDSFLHIYI